jgi:hypothetical protein
MFGSILLCLVVICLKAKLTECYCYHAASAVPGKGAVAASDHSSIGTESLLAGAGAGQCLWLTQSCL